MNNAIFGFSLKLLVAISFVFCIHITVLSALKTPLFENLIIASYLTNYLMALVIYIALYLLKKKYLDLLGFIFMGGSFLKFGVYFVFFNPSFKQNGTVNAFEAAAFMIPYFVCLLLETTALIKLLNSKP